MFIFPVLYPVCMYVCLLLISRPSETLFVVISTSTWTEKGRCTLAEFLDMLITPITRIVDFLSMKGVWSQEFKQAIITSLLKKPHSVKNSYPTTGRSPTCCASLSF